MFICFRDTQTFYSIGLCIGSVKDSFRWGGMKAINHHSKINILGVSWLGIGLIYPLHVLLHRRFQFIEWLSYIRMRESYQEFMR
jgi:hypothetical protein